jgi:hypothetical protein
MFVGSVWTNGVATVHLFNDDGLVDPNFTPQPYDGGFRLLSDDELVLVRSNSLLRVFRDGTPQQLIAFTNQIQDFVPGAYGTVIVHDGEAFKRVIGNGRLDHDFALEPFSSTHSLWQLIEVYDETRNFNGLFGSAA